ncbi:hypothetical protein [Roseisolibacter agri]|uniref:Uncharacterized protein n=1 Tax=Roseisolibacter agri TaxID=2014610 RepID=A0AA37QBH2_9BACT|nr:hypothetical protein [Roseisolibacter agri]GLC26656.1 hypothetical protein rosag_31690 [Roseisolibacter agri]
MPPADTASRGIFSGRPLERGERLVLAVIVGVLSAARTWGVLRGAPHTLGKDFTYPWRAARALLAGRNPYDVIQPGGPYPLESGFPYPLPAAFPALPLAHLPVDVATTVFMGLTCALFAYAFLRPGLWRLWALPTVAYALTTALGQWGPLLIAGALLPGLGFLLSIKPTLGLALFAYRPSRAAVVGGAVLALVALAMVPTWPLDWLHVTRAVHSHPAPVTMPWGWLPLLALFRWRSPEARLVAVLACVPQNLYFYDQLPLWLVPWNALGTLTLSAGSIVAWGIALRDCPTNYCGPSSAPGIIALLYLPATVLALLRPEPDGRPAPLVEAARRWLAARRAPAVAPVAREADGA